MLEPGERPVGFEYPADQAAPPVELERESGLRPPAAECERRLGPKSAGKPLTQLARAYLRIKTVAPGVLEVDRAYRAADPK